MMTTLKNATVVCISSNGIVEGHHFLTLICCRPALKSPPGRRRTRSLPSSFDDNLGSDGSLNKKGVNAAETISRCLSENFLEGSTSSNGTGCFSCIDEMVKQNNKGKRRKRRYNLLHKMKDGSRASFGTLKKASPREVTLSTIKNIPKPQRHIWKQQYSSCSGIGLHMDGYQLSYFISEIKRSHIFRTAVLKRWSERSASLLIFVAVMKDPPGEVLDLLGNKMVNSNILLRRSLEHALSWLSTLGGAFSALGDLSQSYAEEAGHVSLTQLRIAMKLDDPGIKSRCRLYAAISLLQRGYLKSARDIVKKEYRYAISLPEDGDPRLRRMCLGVWAKLQYYWKMASLTEKKSLKSTMDGFRDIKNNAKYWNVYDLEEGRKIMPFQEEFS